MSSFEHSNSDTDTHKSLLFEPFTWMLAWDKLVPDTINWFVDGFFHWLCSFYRQYSHSVWHFQSALENRKSFWFITCVNISLWHNNRLHFVFGSIVFRFNYAANVNIGITGITLLTTLKRNGMTLMYVWKIHISNFDYRIEWKIQSNVNIL